MKSPGVLGATVLVSGVVLSGLVVGPAAGSAVAVTAGAVVTCGGQPATIIGTAGADRLFGTPGRDVIAGLGGNDTIDGRGGDDLVCGGAGGDRLKGGAGDDRLYSGPGDPGTVDRIGRLDVLIGGAGDDRLVSMARNRYIHAVVSFEDSPNAVRVDVRRSTATGWGEDRIVAWNPVWVVGSDHDDRLRGWPGDDHLQGGKGDDILLGHGGNDTLLAGQGDDRLFGGSGNDFLATNRGRDQAYGNRGKDQVYGGDRQPDIVDAGPGNDQIFQHVTVSADQSVAGGPGRDRVSLYLDVKSNGETVRALVTTDMVAGIWTFTDRSVSFPLTGVEVLDLGGRAIWTAIGTDGDDVYRAGYDTRLFASMGAGNDVAHGSRFADTVVGGPGYDRAKTRGRDDTCVSVESLPLDDCEHVS